MSFAYSKKSSASSTHCLVSTLIKQHTPSGSHVYFRTDESFYISLGNFSSLPVKRRLLNSGPVTRSRSRVLSDVNFTLNATGWTVRGSNPGLGGARFSAPVQTGPGAHPASYKIGIGFLSRAVKRPGRDVVHQPSFSAEVKERVGLYLWVFETCSRVKFTFTFYLYPKHLPVITHEV